LLELGKIEKQNALKIFCSLDQHKEEDIQTDLEANKISEYEKLTFSLPPDSMIDVPVTCVDVSLCKYAQTLV
jgi:hypothetical protein